MGDKIVQSDGFYWTGQIIPKTKPLLFRDIKGINYIPNVGLTSFFGIRDHLWKTFMVDKIVQNDGFY